VHSAPWGPGTGGAPNPPHRAKRRSGEQRASPGITAGIGGAWPARPDCRLRGGGAAVRRRAPLDPGTALRRQARATQPTRRRPCGPQREQPGGRCQPPSSMRGTALPKPHASSLPRACPVSDDDDASGTHGTLRRHTKHTSTLVTCHTAAATMSRTLQHAYSSGAAPPCSAGAKSTGQRRAPRA